MKPLWSVREILDDASRALKGSWTALALVSGVLAAILYAVTLVFRALDSDNLIEAGITSEAILSFAKAGQAVLSIGGPSVLSLILARASLDAARGHHIRPRTLVPGARQFLSMLVLHVITLPIALLGVLLFAVVLALPVLAVAELIGDNSVGMATALFGQFGAPLLALGLGGPTAVCMTGLCLAPFFIVDRRLGPIAASRAAWQACAGRRGSVAVYSLVAVTIFVVGLLCCCVGVLFSAPLAMLGFAAIYLRSTAASASMT